MAEVISMSEKMAAEEFPPGDYLKEFIDGRGWTQEDLAAILGRPLQLVNEVVLGKRRITPETARGFAEAFGTSAELWLNLDSAWQLYKSRDAVVDPSIPLRARIYSKGPIKEMVKRGWIEHSSNPEVLEQRVLDFYDIKDLNDTPSILSAAARKSDSYESLTPPQQAWMCRAHHLGKLVSVSAKFDSSSIDKVLIKLRSYLRYAQEVRHVPEVLADAGVRFVVVEHLAKTKIDGACLWLDQKSPVVALSLRYDRIDYFWFTLMHELAHAARGDGLKNSFSTLDVCLVGEPSVKGETKPNYEVRADQFAEQALVPQDKLDDFISRKRPLFSERDVLAFASLHEVHPGIVAGQLQHREGKYNKFRRLLEKMRDQLTATALTDGWGHVIPAEI